MYSFIDVNELPTTGGLPTEAVSINGEYLENLIDGYRTLYTQGRESLSVNLETYSVGSADGEMVKFSNYPSRTIKIGFQLLASSAEEFRQKLNHLNNLLSIEDADVSFYDEPDKFFTGTPISSMELTTGRNNVTGEWQLYCPYPFKRSADVYEALPSEYTENGAKILLEYNGTYPSKPLLLAEFAGAKAGGTSSEDGDCGFVAFIDNDGNIIQLGNPDAVDFEEYEQATTHINKAFTNITGWSTSGGSAWNDKVIDGSVSVKSIKDTNWNKGKGQTLTYAAPTHTALSTGWHGPILRQAVQDTDYFDLAIVHRMCINKANEVGSFEVGAYASDGTMVAGIVIDKSASGNNGTVTYIVDGESRGTAKIDLSYYNTNFGYCKKTTTTKTLYYDKKKKKYYTTSKKGRTKTKKTTTTYTQSNLNTTISRKKGTITFKVGNLAAKSFTSESTTNVTSVSFHFGRNKNIATLNTNAVRSVKFTANKTGLFADIANVFTAGDIVEADTYDGTVSLRRADTEEGQLAPQYGALGNDWEGFQLSRGTNEINVLWSDWIDPDYKPSVRVLYNEVFI